MLALLKQGPFLHPQQEQSHYNLLGVLYLTLLTSPFSLCPLPSACTCAWRAQRYAWQNRGIQNSHHFAHLYVLYS